MTRAGFTLAGEDHPISPVMLWDEKLCQEFARYSVQYSVQVYSTVYRAMLEAEGIFVIGLSFPVVARGKVRIIIMIIIMIIIIIII